MSLSQWIRESKFQADRHTTDTVNVGTANGKVYGYTILVGAGAGCYIVAGFGIVQSLVPAKDIANAVGAMAICKDITSLAPFSFLDKQQPDASSTAQDLGMVLFLAISGTIFQNIAIQKVRTVLLGAPTAQITNLVAGTSSTAYQSLSEPDKAAVIPQLAEALGNVWLFFLVAGALSFVLSLPLFVSHSKPAISA